jgi:hypothetical protein
MPKNIFSSAPNVHLCNKRCSYILYRCSYNLYEGVIFFERFLRVWLALG